MKMRFLLALVLSAFASVVSAAAEKTPNAVDLMFKKEHIKTLAVGKTLNYKFTRKDNNTTKTSSSFEDDILIDVVGETAEKAKNIHLKVFSGDRGRPIFKSPGMTVNLVLRWFLDRSVATMMSVAGGNKKFMQGVFMDGLSNDAKVEATKVEVDGKQVDGYKISVTPYTDNKNSNRMRGYQNATFEFIVSEQVPGQFYQMTSSFKSPGKDTLQIVERLKFVNFGATQ